MNRTPMEVPLPQHAVAMRVRVRYLVPFALGLVVSACDALLTAAPDAGDVMDGPIDGLTPTELAAFASGDEQFERRFTGATGLGPIFNNVSCGACHPGDGRGRAEPEFFNVVMRLNLAVVQHAPDILAAAQAADEALARGDAHGPLHGVPCTIKDNIDVAGLPTSMGTVGRAEFVPTHDATVVRRLRSAGAIVLGKTNMPDLGLAPETDNLVYGRTNNPYDLEHTPGGSSGGEAATIAAGGSPFGIGNDSGGSLRIPGHWCGVAALKPTTGRVPKTTGDPAARCLTEGLRIRSGSTARLPAGLRTSP